MSSEEVIRFTTQAMLVALYASAPAIAVGAIAGIAISLVQAIMSLQDQTISFGLKLIAVSLAVFITAPWACALILNFAQSLFYAIFLERSS